MAKSPPENPTAAASLASAASMVLLFEALPDALARRKVLDQLERAHVKLLAREAGPELDDEQQTAAQVASLASQVHPESALPSRTSAEHAEAPRATRLVEPDECAANMNGHSFGAHGPQGEEQCRYCAVAL